jgi:hypothetical protein
MMDMVHERERTTRISRTTASARERKLRAEKRLRALRALWDDPERYDRIVASGRYLKLCALLQFASEAVERASGRLDRDIRQA